MAEVRLEHLQKTSPPTAKTLREDIMLTTGDQELADSVAAQVLLNQAMQKENI